MRTIKTLNREAPRICFHFCPLQRRHIEAPKICFFFKFSDSTENTLRYRIWCWRKKKKKQEKEKLQRGREKPSGERERKEKKWERVNKRDISSGAPKCKKALSQRHPYKQKDKYFFLKSKKAEMTKNTGINEVFTSCTRV